MRTVILLALCLVMLAGCATPPVRRPVTTSPSTSSTTVPLSTSTPRETPRPSYAQETPGDVVYITGGECYHRAGCRTMKTTPRRLSRSGAIAMGRRPCRVCNP